MIDQRGQNNLLGPARAQGKGEAPATGALDMFCRQIGLGFRLFPAGTRIVLAARPVAPATPVAQQMAANEEKIVQELNDAQGQPVDIGGYYLPSEEMTAKAMRPSATLNGIIDGI